MKRKAIFLDRDGTLIVNKHYLSNSKGIEYLPGVFECLNALKNMGYEFVIVTNQSGIPRGLITEEQLTQIHQVLEKDFADKGIEFLEFYHAPHLPNSNHPDRKPNPGMLLKARDQFQIDMQSSWMIGDSKADLGAATNAGIGCVIIGSGFQIETSKVETHCFENWEQIQGFFQSQTDS